MYTHAHIHTNTCVHIHAHTHTPTLTLTHSVDNSEWMRNGDFIPTRLQAQQDAVNVVCRMKTRQNVENSVGVLTLAEYVSVACISRQVVIVRGKLD